MQVDNDKSKAKISELIDRTKIAEKEIQLREEADEKRLNPETQEAVLKKQLKKQREDIMVKR